MSKVKISYCVEGLQTISPDAPEKLQAQIEYRLPERQAVESAQAGVLDALRQLLAHPGVAQMISALESAEVRIEGDNVSPSGVTRMSETLPVGKRIRQMFRLAQAKLGV